MIDSEAARQVFVIYSGDSYASHFRCCQYEEALKLGGIPCIKLELRLLDLAILTKGCFLILHRIQYDKKVAEAVAWVKTNNGIVVCDFDDLIFDPSMLDKINSYVNENRLYKKLYLEEVIRYQKTLINADYCIVTTNFLLDYISNKYQKPSQIFRTFCRSETANISKNITRNMTKSSIVVGYASGTLTHNKDFTMVKFALQNILEEFQNVELYIVGWLDLDKELEVYHSRIKRYAYTHWRNLPSILAQFDVNLAPLEINNPFCEAKSEIKYVEAALLGIPTLASATDAFKFAIRDGDNGVLIRHSNEWLDCLRQIIKNPSERLEIGQRALSDAALRYSVARRSTELIHALNLISLLALNKTSYQLSNVINQSHLTSTNTIPVSPSSLRKAWYAFRFRGYRITLLQMLLTFRNRIRFFFRGGR